MSYRTYSVKTAANMHRIAARPLMKSQIEPKPQHKEQARAVHFATMGTHLGAENSVTSKLSTNLPFATLSSVSIELSCVLTIGASLIVFLRIFFLKSIPPRLVRPDDGWTR